jgi:hypothetical protein
MGSISLKPIFLPSIRKKELENIKRIPLAANPEQGCWNRLFWILISTKKTPG